MKKRILLLSSSPRRHGNSDRLCDEFLRGAREAGHDAEKISLRDCRIGYCTGCGVCYDTRTCPQRDDAAQIVGNMIAADVIVLATPVYFYTMSAQMKTLIDRCCARYTEMTGKEFYFIVAAADDSKAAMNGRSTVSAVFWTVSTIPANAVRSTASGRGKSVRSRVVRP